MNSKRHAGLLLVATFSVMIAMLADIRPAQADRHDDRKFIMLNPAFSLSEEPYADSKTHAAILGVRMHRQVELGLQQTVNYAGIADAEQIWDRQEMWRGRTSGFANLDLTDGFSGFVPFVGAFAGIDYDARDASAFLGPQAGFSQFLDEQTFVRFRYRYEWQVDNLEEHDFAGTADEGDHILSLGLGVNF